MDTPRISSASTRLCSILGAVITCATSLTAANLLINGGFEAVPIAGNLATYTSGNTPTGFGWTLNSAATVFNSGSGSPAMAESQSLYLSAAGSGIAQVVQVVPGEGHTLSWWTATLTEGDVYTYTVRINGQRLIFLKEYTNSNETGRPTAESVTFAPSEGTITISLTSLGGHPVAFDALLLAAGAESPDADLDGLTDLNDNSLISDLRNTLWVGASDTGVTNALHGKPVDTLGCSLADRMSEGLTRAAIQAKHPNMPGRVLPGNFVKAMTEFLDRLVAAGLLTKPEHNAILDVVKTVDGAQFLP